VDVSDDTVAAHDNSSVNNCDDNGDTRRFACRKKRFIRQDNSDGETGQALEAGMAAVGDVTITAPVTLMETTESENRKQSTPSMQENHIANKSVVNVGDGERANRDRDSDTTAGNNEESFLQRLEQQSALIDASCRCVASHLAFALNSVQQLMQKASSLEAEQRLVQESIAYVRSRSRETAVGGEKCAVKRASTSNETNCPKKKQSTQALIYDATLPIYLSAADEESKEQKYDGPWTEEEVHLCLEGIKRYGENNWGKIASDFVSTRTPHQVREFARCLLMDQHSKVEQHGVSATDACNDGLNTAKKQAGSKRSHNEISHQSSDEGIVNVVGNGAVCVQHDGHAEHVEEGTRHAAERVAHKRVTRDSTTRSDGSDGSSVGKMVARKRRDTAQKSTASSPSSDENKVQFHRFRRSIPPMKDDPRHTMEYV